MTATPCLPTGLTLTTLRRDDGSEGLGLRTPRGVLDVARAAALLKLPAPASIDAMLQEGRAAELHALRDAAAASLAADAALLPESGLRRGRLFARPGKVVCVGLNYRRHAEEIGVPPPRVPPLFSKFANALAAPGEPLTLPPADIATKFDYETELLIVVGRAGRNIAEAEALDYVAGYCTANDFSARDLQMELPNGQWLVGKTLDGFAPVGPWFVSADQVPDPNRLQLETRVNGELRQSSNTADFIFNVQQVLAYISRYWTLEPGDLIFTGTPEGVILGYPEAQRQWLKAGDEVVSSIEGLGDLVLPLR